MRARHAVTTTFGVAAIVALTLGCRKSPDAKAPDAKAPDAQLPARAATAHAAPVDTLTHPAWSRRAVIYEVNVRQFTPEGTLRAIQPHLARLKSLGVDVIWLMPVQPIGRKNRKGPMGSYYSISDYTAINPELGTMADFDALVAAAHREGLKVLLDWVPNHTAFDHPWIAQHPDWYVRKADGTIINARDNEGHDTDWTDVAELNYDDAALRRAMIDAMRWWLEHGKVDGFRCDVAGGVPLDFWMQARADLLKVRPDLFMLAEAEDPRLHAAFDMTYGWEFHHLLNEVAQGKKPAPALDAYLARQDSVFGRDAYRLYFTSNHDENSWNGSEFERMGANAQPAFVLASTLRGSMPLLYTGQEVSLRKRLRFFEKDTVDWKGPSLAPFYHALFDLKHTHRALANGAEGGDQVTLHTDAGPKVYAFVRSRGDDAVLVALNFGDAPVTAAYRDLRTPGTFTDWFSRGKVALSPAGTIAIPAHGYRVLVR